MCFLVIIINYFITLCLAHSQWQWSIPFSPLVWGSAKLKVMTVTLATTCHMTPVMSEKKSPYVFKLNFYQQWLMFHRRTRCDKVPHTQCVNQTHLSPTQNDQRLVMCHNFALRMTATLSTDELSQLISKVLLTAELRCALNSNVNIGDKAPTSTGALSNWLYSFRVPLQSADLLLCGSTWTQFDTHKSQWRGWRTEFMCCFPDSFLI